MRARLSIAIGVVLCACAYYYMRGLLQVTMSASRSVVDQTIKNNKVVVFSKSYCPYCAKAKKALGKAGLKEDKFFVMELDQRKDGGEIQDALLEVTGGRSVPRVFIDGEFLGGGDDTEAAVSSGKLQIMLKEKGIL